jgi:hypothetical protein
MVILCGFGAAGQVYADDIPAPLKARFSEGLSFGLPGPPPRIPQATNDFQIPAEINLPAIQLPPSMVRPAPAISPPRSDLGNDISDFHDAFLDQVPYKGLRFRGETHRDIARDETGYRAGLEWRLFKDGLYYLNKEAKRTDLQKRLQLLQLQNDVHEHQLNEKLDVIGNIQTTLNRHQHRARLKLLADLEKKRRKQLMEGFILREEYDHILLEYNQEIVNGSYLEHLD